MTITFATETVAQVHADIMPLAQLHYDEITLHKHVMKLDPDWPRYEQLERDHKLLGFTARDDGNLIGYSTWFLDAHIHYAGALVASNDMIFLHKDYRNGTTIGRDLIDYSEKTLKEYGVDKAIWHVKFNHDWSAILRRRGYEREDFTVGKIL
jgi:GNAT superfamily N-acetyltransferase